jgi:hypothetical protein
MRKGAMIAGAIVAVAAAGGFLALQVAESRAAAEVERTFAALRATGATIEHNQPKFDLWSRSVRIDNIRIGLAGATAKAVTIARVTAGGLALFSNDFEASRLDISGIEINRALPDRPEWSFAVKVPQVQIANLSLPKTQPTTATGAAAADQVAAAGAYLQQVRIGSIAADTLDATINMPMMTPPAGRVAPLRKPDAPLKYTYSNLKLDRIADGRIGSVGMGKAVFDGPTGSGSIESTSIEDLDLLPFFRVGLDKRKAVDGYYIVQGKQSVGPMTVKMPDGGEFAIASMTGTGFAIDPSKVSIQSMMDMVSTLTSAGPNPSPAQLATFMSTVGQLYEGIRIDDFRMLGMRLAIPSAMPGSEIRVGSIALAGLAQGKLKRLQIDDVVTAAPSMRPGLPSGAPQQIRLGSFALNGFDIAGLIRKAGSFTQPMRPGQPPPSAGQFIAMLEGFEIRDFAVPDMGAGAVTIDAMQVSWRDVTPSGIPAVFHSSFKGVVPVNPRDPNMMQLTQKGIKSLAVDASLASTYSPATFELTISPLSMKIEHFGTLSGSWVVGSVTPTIYEMLALQFNMVAPQLTMKSLDLKFEDAGLITNFYLPSITPGPSGLTPPNPVTEMRKEFLDPAQPGGNLGAILDTLARFLDAPRQTFSLKLAANSAVRFADLMGTNMPAAPGALARTLEKFAVDVRVSK